MRRAGGLAREFAALPTAAKLLLILSSALLPIGLALAWVAHSGIQEANQGLRAQSEEQARAAVKALESLIARNVLALRIAANGAFAGGGGDPCARAQRAVAIAPGVAQQFALHSPDGRAICSVGSTAPVSGLPAIAPGDIRVLIGTDERSLVIRVGVIGGMATGPLDVQELRAAVARESAALGSLVLRSGDREIAVISPSEQADNEVSRAVNEWPISNGQIVARTGSPVPQITTVERLTLLLPVTMWIIAALITWLLVTRLLIRPLKQLQRAVSRFRPGDSPLILPRKLGPSREIQELRDAFSRTLGRIEESEREMAGALDGQRRLVREVHHRVKNNLQVVASLLNIHGRSAETAPAQAAYASIARRVGALSIVHRNHFAEMEETRGLALRPLVAELAAELRAGAPESARSLAVELDVEPANTTQDVAVSVAFLVTEVVEFAMLRNPEHPVEISLRRTSDLTARLTISSPVLAPAVDGDPERTQFERIVGGLAKQLRSELERKLGRYSVDLPIFPTS